MRSFNATKAKQSTENGSKWPQPLLVTSLLPESAVSKPTTQSENAAGASQQAAAPVQAATNNVDNSLSPFTSEEEDNVPGTRSFARLSPNLPSF